MRRFIFHSEQRMMPLLSPAQGCLFETPLTGGAWLVMSREATRFSQDQQIATTYPLWRGCFSLPSFYHICLSLSISLSLSPSSPLFSSVYGHGFWFIRPAWGSWLRRLHWSILPLPMCQKLHLLYPRAPAEDMPISRPALSLEKCRLVSPLSEMGPRYINVMASFLDRDKRDREIDFQWPSVTFLSISGCY